jgi:transcriptional regulator with XRE-family HTH domain
MSNRTLPQQIKDARSLARLSQQELADAVGVARQSISYWENGVQAPTDANMIALRHALGSAFGSKTDAMFSTLQRLHGRSEELAALSRYLVQRQEELSAELAAATRPTMTDDDAAAIAAADAPLTPSAPADAPRAAKRAGGRR